MPPTFGGVVINEVRLKWQDVARLDGDVLYSNLCSACHGTDGKGAGPAVSSLTKGVPDLTVLSANNNGSFPHKQVENVIRGKTRIVARGTIDMRVWGQQFVSVRWLDRIPTTSISTREGPHASHIYRDDSG